MGNYGIDDTMGLIAAGIVLSLAFTTCYLACRSSKSSGSGASSTSSTMGSIAAHGAEAATRVKRVSIQAGNMIVAPAAIIAQASWKKTPSLKGLSSSKSFFDQSPGQSTTVLAIFQEIDKDGSGTVSRDELEANLSKCGATPTCINTLFDCADLNKDGVLSLHEFVKAVKKHPELQRVGVGEEHYSLIDAFVALDSDDDGQVSAAELRTALAAGGLFPDEILQVFANTDATTPRGGDRIISMDEFMKACHMLPELMRDTSVVPSVEAEQSVRLSKAGNHTRVGE